MGESEMVPAAGQQGTEMHTDVRLFRAPDGRLMADLSFEVDPLAFRLRLPADQLGAFRTVLDALLDKAERTARRAQAGLWTPDQPGSNGARGTTPAVPPQLRGMPGS